MGDIINLLSELKDQGISLWLDGDNIRYKAPRESLTESLKGRIINSKNELITLLKNNENNSRIAQKSITPAPAQKSYPLSSGQKGLWLLDTMGVDSGVYNIPLIFSMKGRVNIQAVDKAIIEIMRRHEILRSHFVNDNGNPSQTISDVDHQILEIICLDQFGKSECGESEAELINKAATVKFELEKQIPIKARLIQRDNENYTLIITLHHIVSDGWSTAVLFNEFSSLYLSYSEGTAITLEELPLQYKDYACWQHDFINNGGIQQQLSFWKENLKNAPHLLSLPTDRPRGSSKSFKGEMQNFALEKELSKKVDAYCSSKGVTPFMFFLACYQILLCKHARQKDVCVGVPSAGRHIEKLGSLIGYFINVLVMRCKLANNPTFDEVLQAVKLNTLEVLDNQDVPFDMLVDVLKPQRSTKYNPLVQVGFALQNMPQSELAMSGISIEMQEAKTHTAKHDLIWSLLHNGNHYNGAVEYNTDLFDKTSIELMIKHYRRVVMHMLEHAACPIDAFTLPIVDDLYCILSLDRNITEAIRPLTAIQRDLYMDSVMNPCCKHNSLGYAIEAGGCIDLSRWKQAVYTVTQQQSVLRTKIIECDVSYADIAYQYVAKQADAHINVLDLRAKASTEEEIANVINNEIYRTYQVNSAGDALVQHSVLRVADNRDIIILAAHHMILDGAAGTCLLQEMLGLYHSMGNNTKYESILPDNYNVYIADNADSYDRGATLAFWAANFSKIEPLHFNADASIGEIYEKQISIEAPHWEEIRQYCKSQRITPALYLKTLYGFLLKKYCSPKSDFVISEVVGGRSGKFTTSLGCFYKQLPFIYTVSTAISTFSGMLKYIREAQKSFKEYQDVSLLYQQQIIPKGRINALFNFYNFTAQLQLGGKDYLIQQFSPPPLPEQTQLIVKAIGDDVQLHYRNNDSLLPDVDFLGRLLHLSRQVISGTDNLDKIETCFEAERHKFLYELNAGPRRYHEQRCIHERFETQAKQTPDAIALTCEGSSYSYHELNARAEKLAAYICAIADNQPRNRLVGIYMERSLDMIVAILGVLKSGAAYLPLDPNSPDERLEYIIGDAGICVLISQNKLSSNLKAHTKLTIVDVDSDWNKINASDAGAKITTASVNDLAYVIYTSGSTGRPKGVKISHSNVSRLFQATDQLYGFSADDVWSLFHSFAFDFSVWEIWGALFYGGRLAIVPYEASRNTELFHKLLRDEKVTVLNQTPSAFYQLIRVDAESAVDELNLRYVIFGGEALDLAALKPWYLRHGDQQPKLINMYGITETTVHVTFRELSRQDVECGESSVIGEAIDDLQLLVLDAEHNVVPAGIPGELCVSGAGVSEGYLNHEELTSQKFIANPYRLGSKLYLSGDLARYREDGDIEYLGRIDDQVKIRGYRIETGEIASCFAQMTGNEDVLVLIRGEAADKQLVLFYKTHTADASKHDYASLLRKKLPPYMVPTLYVEVQEWPLTINGKVDKKSLLHNCTGNSANYAAPETDTESALILIMSDLLAQNRIGSADNFFDLGGHSLLAVQLVARIRKEMGAQIQLRDIFEAPVVRGLAGRIDAMASDQHEIMPKLVAVARHDTMPLSYEQQRLWFIEQFNRGSAAYNIPVALRIKGALNVAGLARALNEIIDRHEVLRSNIYHVNGEPVQLIHQRNVQVIEHHNIEFEINEKEAAINNFCNLIATQCFNLESDSLIKLALGQINATDHVLMIVMHHIISDGWSLGVFIDELCELYNAEQRRTTASLPLLAVQYADYAVWQKGWLKGDYLAVNINYWMQQLKGCPAVISLPHDRPRPAIQTSSAGNYKFRISSELTANIRAFCSQQDVTLFMFMLYCYQLLLSRYSGQDDICTGIPIAGRNHADVEKLIGFFINSIVIRSRFSTNDSVVSNLQQLKTTVLEAFDHQDMPAELLLESLKPERNLSYAPITQVAFSVQNEPVAAINLDGLETRIIELDSHTAKYDITMMLVAECDGLAAHVEYNSDLFDDLTIARMSRHYIAYIETVLKQPHKNLRNIHFIDNAELISDLSLENNRVEAVLPLCAMQRDLCLHSLAYPNTLDNSVGYAAHMHHELDVAKFTQALAGIAAEKASLRTRFARSSKPYLENIYQVIDARNTRNNNIQVCIADLSNRKLTSQELDRYISEKIYRSYDIAGGCLIYYDLVKVEHNYWVYICAMHHAVTDGLSASLHFTETIKRYMHSKDAKQGDRHGHDANATTDIEAVGNYITYDREHYDSKVVLEYWKSRFFRVQPLDVFVTKSGVRRFTETQVLADERWQDIKKYCRKQGLTAAIYFKCLYGILLKNACRAEADFHIIDIVSGRSNDLSQAMGCYAHHVPFVFDNDVLSAGITSAFYQAVKLEHKAQKDNQAISVLELTKIIPAARVAFLYNYEGFVPSLDMGCGKSRSITYHPGTDPYTHKTHQYCYDTDAIVHYVPLAPTGQVELHPLLLDDVLTLTLQYRECDFISNHFLERMLLVSDQLIYQHKNLCELDYILDCEKAMLEAIATAKVGFSTQLCLHERVENRVARNPDIPAVSYQGRHYSYAELNRRANRLAHYLLGKGIKTGGLIAVALQRSTDMITVLLAILKTGNAYVPLSCHHPKDRLEYILDDCKADMLITNSDCPVVLDTRVKRVIKLDAIDADLQQQCDDNPGIKADPERLAYIIYTSGSTGRPKGVKVTHHNVCRLFDATSADFNFDAADVWTMFHSYAFDFSVWEIWGALTTGARLVVVPYEMSRSPDEFNRLLVNEGVTVLNQTPSAFYQLIEADKRSDHNIKSLKYVIFGGEALDLKMLAPWNKKYGDEHPQLINMYGITETTVHVTYRRIRSSDISAGRGSLIGRPISDLQIYLLDAQLKQSPPGVPGEICVGGGGVAAGYLNRPQLTQERFITNPISKSGILYRSGDLACMQADGEIEYIGRIDNQVKIRGFRIELGEIEAAIKQIAGVLDCAVLVRQNGDDKRLVAFIIKEPNKNIELRKQLQDSLPDYMIPAEVVHLDAWPLTQNGKLDRNKLLTMASVTASDNVAPRSDTQKTIASIWQTTMGISTVGITDNYFDLGGHSLQAVKIANALSKTFDKDIPLALLYTRPTIAALAEWLDASDAIVAKSLMALNSSGHLPPVFCVHGGGGSAMVYKELSHAMGADRAFYGLQSLGLTDAERTQTSISAMAVTYVEEIRSIQQDGNYLLMGHSFGGLVALEMAKLLINSGSTVTLIIVESPSPEFIAQQQTQLQKLEYDWIEQSLRQVLGEAEMKCLEHTVKNNPDVTIIDWLDKNADSISNDSTTTALIKVYLGNYKALQEYRSAQVNMDITLIKATDSAGHTAGWANATQGNVCEYLVQGNHESILQRPYVVELAGLINKLLADSGKQSQTHITGLQTAT